MDVQLCMYCDMPYCAHASSSFAIVVAIKILSSVQFIDNIFYLQYS